ncbi:carbohydrate kinase family protein [Microbacterium sp. RD1]|uniref:carbohydrate kinase family protein n=1 Tax=Microbacterium sp. RD1 TaxID=3457313 RepID=UPI003FA5FEEC
MTPTSPRVLVVGESVADVVVPQGNGSPRTHAGGSPANVALGLARLGESVTFLTQLGDDAHGELLRAHLTAAGVDLVAASALRTPSATAHLQPDGSARYDFDIEWTLPAEVAVPAAAHLHTGSIAALLTPGADTVRALARGARESGTVSVDPNIRADLLPDHADALARLERLIAVADIVKASDEDVAWLYPGASLEEVERRWLDLGAALTVITRGGEGARAATPESSLTVAPVPATVIDTVGAGDSFMAALLDGLNRLGALGDRRRVRAVQPTALQLVLERSAHAAALTVSRAGADLPTDDDLRAASAPTFPSA